MRTFKSYEKEIFKELYINKKVDIYSFFEKYKLSPAHIAKFILNCKEKNLVRYSDGIIEINENGISFIEENKKSIYLTPNCYWKSIPQKMRLEIQPTIDEILDLSKNDKVSFLQYTLK